MNVYEFDNEWWVGHDHISVAHAIAKEYSLLPAEVSADLRPLTDRDLDFLLIDEEPDGTEIPSDQVKTVREQLDMDLASGIGEVPRLYARAGGA